MLHAKKYTEYSRVVLALTSMGIDATAFQTETKTYDLVSPLLYKQENGDYWAEWQGNNGTCFALLALDSNNYLDNSNGNAARAALIKSLKDKQLESGAWSISGTSPDIDITAAGVYALAPYYLSEAKLTALGGTVTHTELKAMVDGALAYLSDAQNASGGYGSAEADVWALIALASMGRDADTDPAFVKTGGSLLDDLLSYYDSTTGGFKHQLDGAVDQMTTEQTAYGLVAYDRYKNNKNTLYDMTDTNAGVTAVSVGGTAGSIFGTTITVEIPYSEEASIPSSADSVSITPAANATVSALATTDNGVTWTFTVTAEDGTTTKNYTINVFIAANHDEPTDPANTLPIRKTGVEATNTASTTVNVAWTLDLSTIFEDADGDSLTYKVAVDGAEAEAADASYSFTPTEAKSYTFVFTANDGTKDSTQTYTVTLTAHTKGDFGGDGIIDSQDAMNVLVLTTDHAAFSDAEKARYDMNNDGSIDAQDAMMILLASIS